MAKITRCTQKVFAGSVTATGNNAVFGSLKAGSPTYSNDPATIMSLAAWGQGWPDATIGNQSPARQDFSGFQLVTTSQLAYILQEGIAEWDSGTTYFTNSIAKSGSTIYRSITDNNVGNAVTDTTNWEIYIQQGGAARALVCFDGTGSNGTNQTIKSQLNVSSVFKNATGDYTITFTTPFANTNYLGPIGGGIEGSPSDYLLTVGRVDGATKTTTQIRIRTKDGTQSTNSEDVSVAFFAP